MVADVQAADLPDPFDALLVAQPASERITRVRRVGDQSVRPDQLDHLAQQPGLRVVRMNVEIPRHTGQLRTGIAAIFLGVKSLQITPSGRRRSEHSITSSGVTIRSTLKSCSVSGISKLPAALVAERSKMAVNGH